MKILITGAAGFIGSHLAEHLAKKGHEVTGIDNLSDYYDVKLKQDNVESIKKAGVQFIKADLCQRYEYSRIDSNFDFIYHLAAQPGLSRSSTFTSYVNNNIIATKKLVHFAKEQSQLKHFFNVSTSSVYGRFATVSEEVVPKPISTYGITKLAAEQLVLAESRQQNFKASSFFLSSIKRFIFFKAFLYLLFRALFTTVCLEILLILLIADFVLAICAGV